MTEQSGSESGASTSSGPQGFQPPVVGGGDPLPAYPGGPQGVPTGYEVPASAYQRPLVPAEYPDPDDPLITPPNAGIGAWFGRVWGLIGRSWKSLTAIFAITMLLPVVGFAIGGVLLAALVVLPLERNALVSSGQIETSTDDSTLPAFAGGFIVLILALVLILVYLQAVGYAAATYQATKDAAGTPASLGTSLGYGFRRGFGLLGWNFLTGLLILLGIVACVLPGIYVYAATALVGPILLFERRSPIGRSFSIFNTYLGRVLGRLAMTALITIGFSFVVNIVESIAKAALGATDPLHADDPKILIPQLIVAGVGAVLTLPANIFQFAAILSTYAEQRGYEAPVRVGHLAAELDR